ncbi:hypothetical protein HK097_003767, partial [Rhizophlyctis rosea]
MVDMTSCRDRARVQRMKKYTARGFSTIFFETCRHHPRCDVAASQEVRDVLHRMFTEKPTTHPSDSDSDDSDEDDENSEQANLKHDYTPTSLPYGPTVSIDEVNQHISNLSGDWDIWHDRPKEPAATRLTLSQITGDKDKFVKTILEPQPGARMLIPMQFKWIKDHWLRRRIRFGGEFERCYMCGVDVEAEDKRGGCGDGDGVVDGMVEEKGKEETEDTPMDEDANEDDAVSDAESEKVREEKRRLKKEELEKKRQIPTCTPCKTLNAQKRTQTHNLTGLTSVVTGGRTKIGYATAIKLLRLGSTVVVTTRFPLVASQKYLSEPDSSEWKERLKVVGLDLRDLGSVMGFVGWVRDSGEVGRVDVVVNNAAQSVWRPREWYEGIIREEEEIRKAVAGGSRKEVESVWGRDVEEWLLGHGAKGRE